MNKKVKKEIVDYFMRVLHEYGLGPDRKADFDSCYVRYLVEQRYHAEVVMKDAYCCEITNKKTGESFFKKDHPMGDAVLVACFFYLKELGEAVPNVNPYEGYNEGYELD